jgi:hypothetical protein
MTLKSEFLGSLDIELGESHPIEGTPAGSRRIDVFRGGSFKGPRINATVISGSDALLRRHDDAMQQDVRLTLRTDDGEAIYVTYRGVRHASPEIMARIAKGEAVEQHQYYLRCAPFFEAGAGRYAWLNRIIAVGVGRRAPQRVTYEVYEIL